MRGRDVESATAAERVKRTLRTLRVLRTGLVQFVVCTTAQEQAVEEFVSRRLELRPRVQWEIERRGLRTI